MVEISVGDSKGELKECEVAQTRTDPNIDRSHINKAPALRNWLRTSTGHTTGQYSSHPQNQSLPFLVNIRDEQASRAERD